MAREMPAKASFPDVIHTFISAFKPGATLLNSNQLRPSHLLDKAKNIIHHGYHIASWYITHATLRIANLVGSVHHKPAINQQANDLGEADPEAANGSTIGASRSGLNHERIWMAVLIVGVLSLIVVPGLVLGIVTRQLPWGIALSGAIATVISFFAGLYYHLNK